MQVRRTVAVVCLLASLACGRSPMGKGRSTHADGASRAGGTAGSDDARVDGQNSRADGPVQGGSGGRGGVGGNLGGDAGSGAGISSASLDLGRTSWCGDGHVGPGEECDLASANGDQPAFLVRQQDLTFVVTPIARDKSAGDFYSYTSASAHTGWEVSGEGRIFLYLDHSSLTLSLTVFQGIDRDATNVGQPESQVHMDFGGLPRNTTVAVCDDRVPHDELTMTSDTTAVGDWEFEDNTDGGVLSNLTFPGDWEITVAPNFIAGISSWAWQQSDGGLVYLDTTRPLTIKARSVPGRCREDCTIPRCGDGILDGGEICDSGPHGSDTTCASDCRSYGSGGRVQD